MTNEKIIEELAKALAYSDDETVYFSDFGASARKAYRANVRAVLARLAEIGPSEEMLAAYGNVTMVASHRENCRVDLKTMLTALLAPTA